MYSQPQKSKNTYNLIKYAFHIIKLLSCIQNKLNVLTYTYKFYQTFSA